MYPQPISGRAIDSAEGLLFGKRFQYGVPRPGRPERQMFTLFWGQAITRRRTALASERSRRTDLCACRRLDDRINVAIKSELVYRLSLPGFQPKGRRRRQVCQRALFTKLSLAIYLLILALIAKLNLRHRW